MVPRNRESCLGLLKGLQGGRYDGERKDIWNAFFKDLSDVIC